MHGGGGRIRRETPCKHDADVCLLLTRGGHPSLDGRSIQSTSSSCIVPRVYSRSWLISIFIRPLLLMKKPRRGLIALAFKKPYYLVILDCFFFFFSFLFSNGGLYVFLEHRTTLRIYKYLYIYICNNIYIRKTFAG